MLPGLVDRVRVRAEAEQQVLCGVATLDLVEAAERELGFALPAPLRAVYLELSNGGVGPGYGLYGLEGGAVSDQDLSLVASHELDVKDAFEAWSWPRTLLAICDWGCAMKSLVDVRSGAVFFLEPAFWGDFEAPPPDGALVRTHDSLDEWLDAWARGDDVLGDVYEDDPRGPREMKNPFTGAVMVVPVRRPRARPGNDVLDFSKRRLK